MKNKDQVKISFASYHGLYGYVGMVFSLKNVPGTFERMIVVIFASVKWKFTMIYLDDKFIFRRLSRCTMTMLSKR